MRHGQRRSGEVPALKKFVENPLSVADAIRPDTSWFDANETRQEIKDTADLYGFMKLMIEGEEFEGMKVCLAAESDDYVYEMNQSNADIVAAWQKELRHL